MIVYIAGPYRKGNVDANIQAARKVAIEVWESGNAALCPHLNTAHFEQDCKVPDQVYLEGDLELLGRCDCILMMGDWQSSPGAIKEWMAAIGKGLPTFYYPDLPPAGKVTND